ncbi:ATP-binding cassette domain-containing protein [Paracoccus aerodenitrificans]|uniref:ATP-binding cassette domain-containing protein n=1 Tax=Paracoccus aerodenitrificans TaxID=3017781 RepID=UPI0022F00B9F|nr:ATP-binding cassette domain-containing protein [Paracoccus aerodenitrificans]WBU65695.1 ATP-binding cassette domain-containing protein [Paracoccus aerodenitrificans]
MTTEPVFRIDGLSVEVPGRQLLDGLWLDLPAGQVIGLIGHNGSGKSTLLKSLARQIPFTGDVAFEGRMLRDWPARDLARRLAFLPQHPPPAEGMTVRELTALGRYPWHGALGRFSAPDRDAVTAALEECGLEPFADRLVDTLSGGERQRAWLSMMVAQQAGTLLLDEPISALDIAHAVDVLALVRRMTREQGRTAIIVLHEVNMAARFCDHIVALRGAKLAMQGTPRDLMQPGTLRDIYGLRMEILQREDGQPVAIPA